MTCPSLNSKWEHCNGTHGRFFRGRNTTGIMEDARKAGVLTDNDQVVVICRYGDSLAEPGDQIHLGMPIDNHLVVLVANGGTTEQQVPTVLRVARSGGPYQIIQIERDGKSTILDQSCTTRSHICYGCGKPYLFEEYEQVTSDRGPKEVSSCKACGWIESHSLYVS